MVAKDLMSTDVLTVAEDDHVEDLLDVLVGENIHGAPVLDKAGTLVGVVSQQDVFFGMMTRDTESARTRDSEPLTVRSIMTSPAVSANEDTEIVALCRMMYKLRIHRVPIVCGNAVTGIVSSLDICASIARDKKID